MIRFNGWKLWTKPGDNKPILDLQTLIHNTVIHIQPQRYQGLVSEPFIPALTIFLATSLSLGTDRFNLIVDILIKPTMVVSLKVDPSTNQITSVLSNQFCSGALQVLLNWALQHKCHSPSKRSEYKKPSTTTKQFFISGAILSVSSKDE